MPHKVKNPDYDLHVATSFDNYNHLPADFIADLGKMEAEAPRKYNRYVMNSDEDYDLEGAFYAALMSDALKEGRTDLITLHEPTVRVHTVWDLGIRASDTTAIWLFQIIRNEIWWIDYYENYGEGMDHYITWLEKQNYLYAADWLPHDGKQRMQGRRLETRKQILEESRRNPVQVIEQHGIMDRIELARKYIPRSRFSRKCERGVECLNHYKKKKNDLLSTEAKPVFAPEPLHDWASNGADAFGYGSYVYHYKEIGGVVHGETEMCDTEKTIDLDKAYKEHSYV